MKKTVFDEPATRPPRPKLPEAYRADYVAYGKRGWVGVNGKRYAKREDWEQSIRYAGVRTL